MFKRSLLWLLLAAFYSNAAVHVSQSDRGDAMVVPFYSVANGLNTLLTINNNTDQHKALKVHLREAANGDAVYSFNLYLNPRDMWVAAVLSMDGFVQIHSGDESCVLNLNNLTGPPPEVPDAGWSWETGTIEVFEMGVVDSALFIEVNPQDQCQTLENAWNAQGPNSLWRADATNSMQAASGGIETSASIIDVANGFSFLVPVVHLRGFLPSGGIANHPPEATEPDLSSGDTKSLVFNQGQAITTNWPTGFEAVSAVLMKTTLSNDFTLNSFLSAQSEWIISLPTWRFHQNNPEALAPFVLTDAGEFQLPGDFSRGFFSYDRAGNEYNFNTAIIDPPPPPAEEKFTHNVINYVLYNNTIDDDHVSTLSGSLSDQVVSFSIDPLDSFGGFDRDYEEGKIKLKMLEGIHYVPTSRGDHGTYHGLPMTGFVFQKFINGGAQPGLLAAYAIGKPHSGTTQIDEVTP